MNDNTPQNPDYIRNGILNNLEGMAAWMYGLPEELAALPKADQLQIQMACERLEDRLQQAMMHMAHLTGRRYQR